MRSTYTKVGLVGDIHRRRSAARQGRHDYPVLEANGAEIQRLAQGLEGKIDINRLYRHGGSKLKNNSWQVHDET